MTHCCVCVQSDEAGRKALQQQVAGKADEISALHAEVASLTSEKNAMSEVIQQCNVTCFHAFLGYHAFAACPAQYSQDAPMHSSRLCV